MAETKTERKVTVILATDVVGYSTMMEENEEQTLANLKACRSIIDGLIKEHHGRIFNTAGDSVLAEFQSAVEAVICASEFQNTIKERNNSVSAEEQMQFRLGINMGDVVIEGDNLYGEGVNVAARLEALAQPGGICLSKNVHEIVNKKTDFQFHDLGEQKVKNTVVHAVDVTLDGTTQRKLSKSQQIKQTDPWKKYLVAVVLTTVIVGGGVWWFQQPDFKPADQSKFAYKLPDKPSIAVLPFNNMSGDPSQDYLGDGLTENIISVLATSPNLFVISRNSSFTYKGKATKVQEVAEQLGVRYVLEGSVQKSGEKLRVTAQLVDAVDGKHLWAERFDRKLDDLFAVQDEITAKISEELQIELTVGAQGKTWRKEINDPESFRLLVKGRSHFQNQSIEGHQESEKFFKEFCNLEPEGAVCHTLMGWLHFQKLQLGLTKNPGNTIVLARKHAEKSIAAGQLANSFALYAMLELFAMNYDSALSNIDHALKLGPSETDVLAVAGYIKYQSGEPHEAIAFNKRAIRKNPYHPPLFLLNLGYNYLMIGEDNEADAVFKSILSATANNLRANAEALRGLSATAVFRDDMDKAREYFRKMIEIDPKASVATLMRAIYVWKDKHS